MYQIERIVTDNCLLGESPIWSSVKRQIYFVDINAKKLYAVNWDTREITHTDLHQKTGCIVLDNQENLIYAMEDGVYDSNDNLIHSPFEVSGKRFNDGKIAPDGNFIVGTIRLEGGGKLYSINCGNVKTVLDNVKISNGIDWSVDGKTIYYCDTATHTVVSFDYPSLTNKKTVIEIPENMGNPDGLCADIENNLWIALWGGSAVIHVSSKTGEILEKIDLPTSKISCPCFAGPDLDSLIITSASDGISLKDEPYAGNTFVIHTNVCGKPTYRYRMMKV